MRSLRYSVWALVGALGFGVSSGVAQERLDETWQVSLNGQTVQVNPDGSFRIPNVSAADQFGAGGPGTAPDFLSDDLLLLTGYTISDGTTRYVYSEPFRMPQASLFVLSNLIFSDDPPPYPESIRATVTPKALTIGETAQVIVTGTLLDGTEVDVSDASDGTTYRLSNTTLASISADGELEGLFAGTVFVTAVNFGRTSVTRVDVQVEQAPTTVEGFVHQGGVGVNGASVSLSTGDMTTTDDTGFYSLSIEAGVNEVISASATSGMLTGQSSLVPAMPNGITDLGIINLEVEVEAQDVLFGVVGIEASEPEFMVAADFTGDGIPDLATATDESRLEIHLNLGNGTFAPLVLFELDDDEVGGIAAADFDGDGDIDLVTGSDETSNVFVFINNGGGSFAEPVGFDIGSSSDLVATGDIDGDGDEDIVALTGSSNLRILLNEGNAVFQEFSTINFSGFGQHLIVTDIDNDNDLDILVQVEDAGGLACDELSGCGGSQLLSIFRNAGDGSFAAPAPLDLLTYAEFVTVEDVNGDNLPDVLMSNGFGNDIRIFINTGDATFADHVSYDLDVSPEHISVGDLSGDGVVDLAVTTDYEGVVVFLTNAGDGTFEIGQRLPSGPIAPVGIIDDFDNNGASDYALAVTDTNQVSVYFGNGAGRLIFNAEYPTRAFALDADLADFNLDGIQDFLIADFGNVSVSFGAEHGVVTGSTQLTDSGCNIFTCAADDFDGDGFPDAAWINGCDGTLLITFGRGDGTFGEVRELEFDNIDGAIVAMTAADIDGDLDVDIVVGFGRGGDKTAQGDPQTAGIGSLIFGGIVVALNDGSGNMTAMAPLDDNPAGADVEVANMDGVGGLDIVTVAHDGRIALYHGVGDGAFTGPDLYSGGVFLGALAIADLDGDGDMDVAAAPGFLGSIPTSAGGFFGDELPDEPLPMSLLLNTGGGALSTPVSLDGGVFPTDILAVDITGDGVLDLVAPSYLTSSVAVLVGAGGGVFGAPTRYAGATAGVSTLAHDFDDDGDMDIASLGYTSCIDFAAGAAGGPSSAGCFAAASAASGGSSDDDPSTAGFSGVGAIVMLLNRSIPPDCNGNGTVDDIEIANEAAMDTDNNGVPDSCDPDCDNDGTPDWTQFIEGVVDCNGNYQLDQCEPDCNGSGLPDLCDIFQGLDFDCNDNNLPDECDLASGELTDADLNGIPDQCDRVLFVAADATGKDDGASWTDAFNDLQDALSAAGQFSNGSRTQIWIKAGVYKPTTGTSRFASFFMRNGIEIVGGFAGVEDPATFDLATRDFFANQTVLSGELSGSSINIEPFLTCYSGPGVPLEPGCEAFDLVDDMGGAADGDVDGHDQLEYMNNDLNSFHVLRANAVNRTAVLDGVTVRGGKANQGGFSGQTKEGGGLVIGTLNQVGSPTIRNCVFIGNEAEVQGGGMHISELGSNPFVENCVFLGNNANSSGGALSVVRQAQPIFRNCLFDRNNCTGFGPGAVSSTDSATIVFANSRFYRNGTVATDGGGAVNVRSTTQRFTNCVFIGNRAPNGDGGGLVAHGGSAFLHNCVFAGNHANRGGAVAATELIFDNGFASLRNTILWDNTDLSGDTFTAQIYTNGGTVSAFNTCIEGLGAPTNGNIADDPLLVDFDGADDIAGTSDDDVGLMLGSPCIDTGSNADILADLADLDNDGDTAEPTPFDITGADRIQNRTVDMGAHESEAP